MGVFNDYISRDALIDFANNHVGGIDANDIARFPAAKLSHKVKVRQKKTSIQRKTGRWSIVYVDEGHIDMTMMYKCSNCGGRSYTDYYHCQHCGARMLNA